MDEEIKMYLDDAKEQMIKTIEHTVKEFSKIRAGRASTNMLDGLLVEYYGSPTPIAQVASVTVADARSLIIKPWEKGTIPEIEKAIRNSDLGLSPQNDGEIIRLNIPPLSEERRKEYVKRAKGEAEKSKVSLRNTRRDVNDALKQMQKDGTPEDMVKRAETKVQDLTNEYSKKIDALLEKKEGEIMTV